VPTLEFYDTEIVSDMPRAVEVCSTERLNAAAIDAFRALLAVYGRNFRETLPRDAWVQLLFHQRSRSCATAAFIGRGGLLAMSLLLTGRNPAAERRTIQQLQPALFRAFQKTDIEPGFNLHRLPQRPLHATVFLPYRETPENIRDALIVETARRHFAGAYFLEQMHPDEDR